MADDDKHVYTTRQALDDAIALQLAQSGRELRSFEPMKDIAEPLRLYVHDLNQSPLLAAPSRRALYKLLLRSLAYRLQVLDEMERQKELLAHTAVPPIIFIASFVRSGSTLLHNLLHEA